MKDFLIREKNLQSGTKATCFLWVNSFIPISLIAIYCWIVKISVTLLLFLKLCTYNPLFPLNAIHIVYTQLLNPLWKWASDTSAGETTTGDCTGHWPRVGIRLPPLYNLSSSFPCGEQTRRQRMRPSSSSTSHANISLLKVSLPRCEELVIGPLRSWVSSGRRQRVTAG